MGTLAVPQVASMSSARGSLAAVALNGKIYALGGGQPGISLASTEVYDPYQDAWMPSALPTQYSR